MNSKYIELEPAFTEALSPRPLSFDATKAVGTFETFDFLYVSSITLIIGAAAVMYIIAGGWRIEASERGMRKSNETFKRVTLGLIGVLSMFTVIYTVNRDLLRGDVGLSRLSSVTKGVGTAGVVPVTNAKVSSTPASCDTKEVIISKLNSQDLCGGNSCTSLSGCNYTKYLPEITTAARKYNVDKNLVIAILCKENRGLNTTAQNTNTDSNGRTSYDCGLMQVNQNTPCTQSSYDPPANIDAGVRILSSVVRTNTYPSIHWTASAAAAYNAGAGYNTASVDCTQSAGFPSSVPKWACPINPGNTTYNMCAVKSYACDVSACVKQLSGSGL